MKLSARKTFQNIYDLHTVAGALIGQLEFRSGGDYRITIEEVDAGRTNEQNRFYWAVLNEIADQTGNSSDDLHETFRAMFLTDRGAVPPRIRSTTELDVREFITYIDQILAYIGTEMGITVRQTREF
jgi:hypothetical protein